MIDEAEAAAPRSELTRPFRGVSAVERQRTRRVQLVDAGYEVFGTNGIAGTTVQQICDEAGLIKRYFYESFASMDELVAAVFDHAVDRLSAEALPSVAELGWDDLSTTIRIGMQVLYDDPRMVRLLVIEANSAALKHHRERLVTGVVDLWLASIPGQGDDPKQVARTRVRIYAFIGALGEVAHAGADGRLGLSPAEVTAELVTLLGGLTPS